MRHIHFFRWHEFSSNYLIHINDLALHICFLTRLSLKFFYPIDFVTRKKTYTNDAVITHVCSREARSVQKREPTRFPLFHLPSSRTVPVRALIKCAPFVRFSQSLLYIYMAGPLEVRGYVVVRTSRSWIYLAFSTTNTPWRVRARRRNEVRKGTEWSWCRWTTIPQTERFQSEVSKLISGLTFTI